MIKKKLSELPTDENLLRQWKDDVFDKVDEIDPDDEYIWTGGGRDGPGLASKSLAIGYFIGKGQSPKNADRLMEMANARGWL